MDYSGSDSLLPTVPHILGTSLRPCSGERSKLQITQLSWTSILENCLKSKIMKVNLEENHHVCFKEIREWKQLSVETIASHQLVLTDITSPQLRGLPQFPIVLSRPPFYNSVTVYSYLNHPSTAYERRTNLRGNKASLNLRINL